jgi:hypothetical protein
MGDYCFIWVENSAEHFNDELISEPSLTLVEEMIEGLFEFLEYSRVLN